MNDNKRAAISIQIPEPVEPDAEKQTNIDSVVRGMMRMAEVLMLQVTHGGGDEAANEMAQQFERQTVDEIATITADLRSAEEAFNRLRNTMHNEMVRKLVDAVRDAADDDNAPVIPGL